MSKRLVYTLRVLPRLGSHAHLIADDRTAPRILIVRLGAMGDILRTLPAVSLLHRHRNDLQIDWVVESPWGQLLTDHPALNRVIEFSRKGGGSAPMGLVRTAGRLRERLRARRPELVLDFHGNLRSGIVGWLSGAGARLGYSGHQQKEGNRCFTTARIAATGRRQSRIERNLDLVRALGVAAGELPALDLPLARRGAATAAELLHGNSSIAIVSPGASRAQAYKTPPPELLAGAALHLKRAGIVPWVVWGPGEESLARDVVERCPSAAILAPATDLPTLAGLLARARLFVGGDSGPMHLACAVGCPVVALYGPTDPEVNRPWGVPFRALFPAGRSYTGIKRIDRDSGGFDGLELSTIAAAVDELLP